MPAMSDDATLTATPSSAATDAAVLTRRCPWCSEVLPADATVRCPHCYANLAPDTEARMPGLTEVEAASELKARRAEPVKRSKLLSWISGEVDDPETPLSTPSAPEALAPPDREVRREMLRIQLESEGITVAPDGTIELPQAPETEAPTMTATAESPEASAATSDAPADAPVSDAPTAEAATAPVVTTDEPRPN
jgi:hypothetical protein